MNIKEIITLCNVSNEYELLRVFPSKYESLVPTKIDENPIEGKRYVFHGFAKNIKTFNSRNSSIIRLNIMVESKFSVTAMIYNQSFYLNKITNEKDLLFVCRFSEVRKIYLISLIVNADSYYGITGIRPVYSLPKGISNSIFSSYIRKILSYPMPIIESNSKLPKVFVDKYKLLNEYDSFKCIHLPRNDVDLRLGLRRFKYEEALIYSINAIKSRKFIDNKKKVLCNNFINHDKINEFVKNLKFKLTKDQLQSIREIILDMEKDEVMYRLLQGDVGTGKTIVAFVSLYANFLRGKQGVLMSPTFELSSQHYNNAIKIFQKYKINIKLLSNNLPSNTKKEILNNIKNGTIDIVISTHMAVSKYVEFKNLGLAIVDEQQRFGVKQRNEIVNKGEGTDFLMMSATPIPRTLAQIINSDIEVSTLNQYPHGIRTVETYLIRSTDPMLFNQIDFYLSQKRQIFIIAPKIDEGEKKVSNATSIYKEMCSRYSENQCQLLHGKIKQDEQEKIYNKFLSGKKLILVSTTIVEVGIDVSSASLLIVFDSNYFGLSSLHQLRGRIGRSGQQATALLVYDKDDEDAIDRLKFLTTTNDGLKIATYDLKIRGKGSYSGERQSGKSELRVCNFVDDYSIFVSAKKDAKFILEKENNEEFSEFLSSIDGKSDTFLV